MTEPNPLDQIVECPDCNGTGEQERLVAAGYFGHEGQDVITEPCDCCKGAGRVSLRDLEARI